MEFLLKNDAIINIKDGIMTLDEKEYEISRYRSFNDKYEEVLIEK